MAFSSNSYYSTLLEEAVNSISSLPGVGRKTALRHCLHLLNQPKENVDHFARSIADFRANICFCPSCNMITDEPASCEFCADRSRDRSKICVVASVRDVISIEATGQYHGLYHVLGGVISPINGVGPSDLSIDLLAQRCVGDLEIIFALSSDVEGETTAFYIYRRLSGNPALKFTTLARGLGFGDDLEYADEITLGRSIAARCPFVMK